MVLPSRGETRLSVDLHMNALISKISSCALQMRRDAMRNLVARSETTPKNDTHDFHNVVGTWAKEG